MKRSTFVVAFAAAGAFGWFGRSVLSDDSGLGSESDWAKLSQPGEQHARLKTLVGEWAVHGSFTMPDGKVEVNDGAASYSMILGDRFLRQEVKSTFQGQ